MTPAITDERGRPRVAITGMGVKAPGGLTVEALWDRVYAADPAAAPLTRLDVDDVPVTFGCEVAGFDPAGYFNPKEARRVDRATQLGVAAATDALEDAGDLAVDPARAAVVIGSGVGGLTTLEDQVGVRITKGCDRVSPFLVPMMMANATAGTVAMRFGWTGPCLCVATACAAGANSLGEALTLIRAGMADVAVAGGAEAAITPTAVAAFARMGALSSRHDDPAGASRPFDAERDGFVIGEGAGALVLERLDRALERGTTVHAVLAGYGATADAHHITAPAPGGEGAAACMRNALDDAGLAPDDVAHINAHGTSTPLNDATEAEAIVKVFGDDAPPVTSTKGVTGHLIGAAGAVEAVLATRSLLDEVAPPTANHETPGEEIAVDVVAGNPRGVGPGAVGSNSFGFGGHNASLVVTPAP